MSLDLTAMAADLAFMVADLPDQIVLDAPDGRTLACLAGVSSQSKKLDENGFLGIYDLTVTVQTSLLFDGAGNAQAIALRQKFTHTRSGLKYRVEKLSDDPSGAAVVLECSQVTA
jgi:hypothetical protein